MTDLACQLDRLDLNSEISHIHLTKLQQQRFNCCFQQMSLDPITYLLWD